MMAMYVAETHVSLLCVELILLGNCAFVDAIIVYIFDQCTDCSSYNCVYCAVRSASLNTFLVHFWSSLMLSSNVFFLTFPIGCIL
jgi:hypothetical protein